MKLFLIERLTPVLALACALTVFVAAALDLPEASPGTAAVATGVP
jgi:hypothetical protein